MTKTNAAKVELLPAEFDRLAVFAKLYAPIRYVQIVQSYTPENIAYETHAVFMLQSGKTHKVELS